MSGESNIVGFWKVPHHGKGPNLRPLERAVSEPLPAKRAARVSVVVHSELEGKKAKRREVPKHEVQWSVEPPPFARIQESKDK